MTAPTGRIWIITAPRGAGKTRFCRNLINKAREQGMTIGGVICPPIYEEKEKTAIGIENLESGEQLILARVRKDETEGLLTDHWVFDPKIMAWADHVLGEMKNCDLLVIDELGPLEFTRGEGWQNGIRAIDKGNYGAAVVVIRPELLSEACKRWPCARILEIPPEMDAGSEARLHKTVLSDNLS